MALLITGVSGAAAAAGVEAGGRLAAINGEPVLDFVDYNWFSALPDPVLEIVTDRGAGKVLVRKSAEEPIGLALDGLYPDERHCANRCVFCFVDQMPQGMRESLYVKDDDWRYSVLFGNYITLTNVPEKEFARILRRAPSPLYVSVHATDPAVRAGMMGNRAAGGILGQLRRLAGAGISVHCQVVLVPGMNDGAVLERTLEDLYGLYPAVRTVAVVPLGLTRHRVGLADLKPVGRAEAIEAAGIVERFAAKCRKERGARFAFLSDEMAQRAGLPEPRYADGEHSPQLANGVGLMSDFLDEFEWALGELPAQLNSPRRVTVATGVSARGFMGRIALELQQRVGNLRVDVLCVENSLFGEQVTVAGLLCGADIARAAASLDVGDELLLPQAALKSGEDVFLDGMTLEELSNAVGARVRAVPCDGAALTFAACGLEE